LRLPEIASGKAMVDADVAPFDLSKIGESQLKGSDASLVLRIALGKPMQKGDPAHSSALLRPCRERPCRRAAEKRDDLPPPHSITSSARARSVGGMVRPSALAVFKLTIRSTLVDFWTGRSAGFSPLRIRPV
jgi:hypothetical protein